MNIDDCNLHFTIILFFLRNKTLYRSNHQVREAQAHIQIRPRNNLNHRSQLSWYPNNNIHSSPISHNNKPNPNSLKMVGYVVRNETETEQNQPTKGKFTKTQLYSLNECGIVPFVFDSSL